MRQQELTMAVCRALGAYARLTKLYCKLGNSSPKFLFIKCI